MKINNNTKKTFDYWRKLAEEAVAEGQKVMDELKQKREQILSELEELKERYLALVEKYFRHQADEKEKGHITSTSANS